MTPEQTLPLDETSDTAKRFGPSVTDRKFRAIKLSRDGDIVIITIDHPDNRFNLMDQTLHEDLAAVMADLRTEHEARAIVLTANGKYFSAGGNFNMMSNLDRAEYANYISRLAKQTIYDMLQVPVPIICAMNGPAIGFGASPVLLSDIVFAGEDVTLSDPHVLRGLASPDGPAMWSLAMGPVRAKRFLLTGEKLTADQAADLGLITFVTPTGEALTQAMEFARKLAAGPRSANTHTKLLCNIYIRQALDMSLDTAVAWEHQDSQTDDHREAIAAFRERRNPHFTGS